MGRKRSATAFKDGVPGWVYDSDSDTETVRNGSPEAPPAIHADSIKTRKRSGTAFKDGIAALVDEYGRSQEQDLYEDIGKTTDETTPSPTPSTAFVWDDLQNPISCSDDYFSRFAHSSRVQTHMRGAQRISQLSLRRGRCHCYTNDVCTDAGRFYPCAPYCFGSLANRDAKRISELTTRGHEQRGGGKHRGYRPIPAHVHIVRGGRDTILRQKETAEEGSSEAEQGWCSIQKDQVTEEKLEKIQRANNKVTTKSKKDGRRRRTCGRYNIRRNFCSHEEDHETFTTRSSAARTPTCTCCNEPDGDDHAEVCSPTTFEGKKAKGLRKESDRLWKEQLELLDEERGPKGEIWDEWGNLISQGRSRWLLRLG